LQQVLLLLVTSLATGFLLTQLVKRLSSRYVYLSRFITPTAFFIWVWKTKIFFQEKFFLYLLCQLQKTKHARLQVQKPKRIILIRHGESAGNVDSTLYAHIPDNQIELTEKGLNQAREAGVKLRKIIGDETLRFFVSPYTRSYQTFYGLLEGAKFPEGSYTVREEVRLREQDWGNLQEPQRVKECVKERRKFGAFYYRFPNGESGADVYDRLTSFVTTLFREWKYEHCLENFVLVSHGLTIRLFLMRYYKWTVEEFHQLHNPTNCEMFTMDLQPNGKYILSTKLRRNKLK